MKFPQTTTEERLTRGRTRLVLDQPFFGTLSLRLKLTPGRLPTMATDGTRIVYNPTFVDGLKPMELEGTLAHEVLHCALGHHCRRGNRDPGLWNEAADLAINPILIKNGFTLPAGALLDPAFTDSSAEEIYARLLRKSGQGGTRPTQSGGQATSGGMACTGLQAAQGPGTQDSSAPAACQPAENRTPETTAGTPDPSSMRPGGFGEVWDATDEQGHSASPAEMRRQEHEWNIAAEQALRSAKARGHEPGGVDRPLSESRESKQDWRAILRDFIAAAAPSDYRWTPPNRRYIASGLYLPSVERHGLGEIVIVVDTSGSIGKCELEQFAAEISAISEEAQPETIYVVYCDATIQAVQEFRASEPVRLEPKGGGGTDFRPAFSWVTQKDIPPACLIYLTDLCCDSFPETPDYPVLWVTESRRTGPFGETVRLSPE